MPDSLRKQNVVIINPPNVDKDSYIARSADRWPHRVKRGKFFSNKMFPKYPLYLMYAAAVLEKSGFEVTVIDAAERNYDISRTIEEVKKIKPYPILAAIEISSPSLEQDMEFIKKLKESIPFHINLLGAHASVYHKELLSEYPYLDSVIRGEFILALNELVNCLSEKKDLAAAKGVSYIKDARLIINEDMPIIDDLDKLPYPARHLLDPRRYLMGHYTYEPQLLMITSMGCPYRCIFCLWPKVLYKRKVILRRPDEVVKEILLLKNKYGAREIYFDDDCFNISIQRVMDVCQEIIKNKVNIPWITEMRCNNVSYEMLKMMKKAGCIKILYGVESGNQDILDSSKKSITLQQVKDAFKLTEKAGIKSHATFMFGLPGETNQTITQTIKFAKKLNPDTIQCSIALPYPGTEFYDLANRDGSLKVKKWLDFDGELCGVIEYNNLGKGIISASVNRMYREFYTNPRHIIKQVLSVRSFSDMKRFINLGLSGLRRFS